MSTLHEPGTSNIIDRIKAINAFIDAGYSVHINFSPVIVEDNWLEDYEELFTMVNDYVDYKDQVLAEVIFLTHNEKKHEENLVKHRETEVHLWNPAIQEEKVSQYGGTNVRYARHLKHLYIDAFKALHEKIIPWNTIRYIF